MKKFLKEEGETLIECTEVDAQGSYEAFDFETGKKAIQEGAENFDVDLEGEPVLLGYCECNSGVGGCRTTMQKWCNDGTRQLCFRGMFDLCR